MNFSLAIPAYESSSFISRSFAEARFHPAISEINISDDCSNDFSILHQIAQVPNYQGTKPCFRRNPENVGAFYNKREAVRMSKCEFTILLDSDNRVPAEYIDAAAAQLTRDPSQQVILCPQYAKPSFSFNHFGGVLFTARTVKNTAYWELQHPTLDVLLNNGNYVVPTHEFLRVHSLLENGKIKKLEGIDHKATPCDSMLFAYYWLLTGHAFGVCDDMWYTHVARGDSLWMKNQDQGYKDAAVISAAIKKLEI